MEWSMNVPNIRHRNWLKSRIVKNHGELHITEVETE